MTLQALQIVTGLIGVKSCVDSYIYNLVFASCDINRTIRTFTYCHLILYSFLRPMITFVLLFFTLSATSHGAKVFLLINICYKYINIL